MAVSRLSTSRNRSDVHAAGAGIWGPQIRRLRLRLRCIDRGLNIAHLLLIRLQSLGTTTTNPSSMNTLRCAPSVLRWRMLNNSGERAGCPTVMWMVTLSFSSR
jgi:hypothetical protein